MKIAYEQGYEAYCRGLAYTEIPPSIAGTDAGHSWMNGWRAALSDVINERA